MTTTLEKKLDTITKRENLSQAISENVKYYKEKLPLDVKRKAFFVKDALQYKYRLTNPIFASNVCDEINTMLNAAFPNRLKHGCKRIFNSAYDFVGKEFGSFTVIDVVGYDHSIHRAHVIVKCKNCGATKQRLLRGIRFTHKDKLICNECGK